MFAAMHSADTAHAPGQVLVVDDDESVRRSVTRALRYDGFAVTSVGSGEEALEALRAKLGGFDVVVSDIVMRGMSGVALCRAVRELDAHAVVILISGFPGTHLSERAISEREFELLEKPFTPAQLTRRVWDALSRRRG
jgi:two-component system cell cycle sensor histidine kinase/response regulator CckA